jgi:hypothetical protein
VIYHSPGALHIHSRFSDGTGDLDEIARAARRAGLEWIGMTDHNTLAPTYRGFEGVHDGLVVIVGYEWTPDGGDHMLVYGESAALGDQPLDPTLPPGEAIAILGSHGALTHLAHPDERRGVAIPALPPYPWHDWNVRGMRGIELWNYMSEWAERLTPANRLLHVLLPGTGLGGPTDRVLRWWDALNVPVASDRGAPAPRASAPRASRRRPAGPLPGRPGFAGGDRLTVGVSGTDVHAFRIRALGRTLTIFPYAQVFRAFTNYLRLPAPLPTDIEPARAAILSAIADGRLYFANRRLGDALGLELTAAGPDGREAGPGEWLAWAGGAELRVHSPRHAALRLLRDGTEIARGSGRSLRVEAPGPGSYRLEARRFGEPWAYTNPVVLTPP